MASIIPIPQKSAIYESKAKSHPSIETLQLPPHMQRSRHQGSGVRVPPPHAEPNKVFLKIKRCLHCQYPIYCPHPKNDPNFCSKDCATCYNWFRTTEPALEQTFAAVPCQTSTRNIDTTNEDLALLEDIQSFSYRPTWLKSDNA